MTIDLHTLLRELLSDPAARAAYDADPAGWLGSHGHDLPDDLVGEAIGQVAAGLPADVAESLAPFVMADSPVPTEGVEALDGSGLDLLRALDPVPFDEPIDASSTDDPHDLDFGGGAADGPADAPAEIDDPVDWGDDLEAPVDPVETPLDDPLAGLDGPSAVEELPLDAGFDDLGTDDPMDLDGLE